jgi:hypothetical protein
MPANTTCDIYRVGNSPPSAPDVAGVKCFLVPKFSAGHHARWGGTAPYNYTHILYVDYTTDIRDAYNAGAIPATMDTVYIPDKTSKTSWLVVFVERVSRGTGLDHKRVYLRRQGPAWPTNDV